MQDYDPSVQWRIQTRRLGGSQIRERQNFSLVKYPWFFVTIVGNHINVAIVCRLKRWQFLLDELLQSFMESQKFKITFYHNSHKVWSGSKKMGPVFHRSHITENIVGIPKMFYITINAWKIYPKAVVLNLSVIVDQSNAWQFLRWLLFFNTRNEVTSVNHQTRLLQYSR